MHSTYWYNFWGKYPMTLVLCLATVGPVWAQDPGWPGHVEVTDSEYLNVTLDSSEPVTVYLDSVPQIVAFDIEAAEGAASTQITLTGLAPDTTYYKYEDDFHNPVEMTSTAEGTYAYTQDLVEPHLVLIQTQPSTYFISDDGVGGTGGDCASIGTWDGQTRTCTLGQDVGETIQIDSGGITLDGNGYTLTAGGVQGVSVPSRKGNITVMNLYIEGALWGVFTQWRSSATIINSSFTDCVVGVSGTGATIRASNFTNVGDPIHYWRGSYVAEGNNFIDTGLPRVRSGTMSGNYWEIDGIPRDIPQDGNAATEPLPGTGPPQPGGNFLPVVDAGGPYSGDAGAAIALAGSASDPNGDPLEYAWSVDNAVVCSFDDPNTLNPNLTCTSGGGYQVTLTVDDGQGDPVSDSATVTVEAALDTTPPEITPHVSGTLGDNGWYVSDVTVSWDVTDLESEVSETSGCEPTIITTDTNGETLTCMATSAGGAASESVTIQRDATAPTASASASPGPNAAGWKNTDVTGSFTGADAMSGISSCTPDAVLATEGEGQSASGTCTDLAGNVSALATASGINIDKTPPTASASASPGPNANGWNNSDVTVSFDGADNLSGIDACDPAVVLSSEGANQSASGACTDLAGNVSAPATASGIDIDKTPPTLTIVVPQLYDVQPVGTALDFSADDTLSGLAGPAMATLTSETETLVMASGEQPGVGVYTTVVVEATDLAGNTVTSEPRLLVIYDPEGGFVTGGGWIMSPEGACPRCPTSPEGKANFGFVSKYKKGATVPTGNTEFQFKAGGLNFHSDSYEWLVVTSSNYARFKGVGTINGEGAYKFQLWAGDGTGTAGADTFRIRIWEEDEPTGVETDIYDNGMDQDIGGGNIKVHDGS